MLKKSTGSLGRLTAEEFSRVEKMPVTAVADNVRSMNNVGSLFRTCDAFSAAGLVLCGISGTPPHREIHKTALGAEETVEWRYAEDTAAELARLKAEGYTILAAEQAEGSVPLHEFRPQTGKKYAVVFGNEVDGVSQGAADLCDGAIEIPQAGTKHSLNVSVAAGVVLWHFFSALRKK